MTALEGKTAVITGGSSGIGLAAQSDSSPKGQETRTGEKECAGAMEPVSPTEAGAAFSHEHFFDTRLPED